MKPAALALLLLFFGANPGAASLLPEDFRSVQLPNAGGGTNQWFFFPDAQKNPRIVAKIISNAASVARTTLTGGPPTWTASAGVNTAGLNKEGVFVPSGSDSGFLVGAHIPTGGTARLRMWTFGGTGVGDSLVDPEVATGFQGVSAALDPAGNLHAAWVWSPGVNECLVYGRRSSAGVWQIAQQVFNRTNGVDNKIRLGDTAVVPSAFGTANIYFTLTSPITQPVVGTVTSLMRMNSLINGNTLFLANPSNPPLVSAGVKDTLRGSRVGSSDRVYFFIGNSLRRWNGGGETEVQAAVAGATPRSIHYAIDPIDGLQRVAWYDANSKKIHYLKPNAPDLSYTAFNPVTIPGNGALADADLHGLHFNEAGIPFILYRRAAAEGYVAFPNDEYDMDGNGRAEVIDEALGSPKALIETLPLGAVSAGPVLLPANRFKFRFPTGNSTNIAGAKLESPTKNLRIEVEVSPNGTTWSRLTTPGSVAFTLTASSGTNPNQIRTYAAVLPEEAPGSLSRRFARLIVTRLPAAY